ncbi:MAG TPA: hypothetical protein VKE74_05780 [Gemmataceae bacterium]|nr:hypothetical protein [Gemmataceae bacterium]
MTELAWMACPDPAPMLRYLHEKVSGRKLRLFACACARNIWPMFPRTDNGKQIVIVSERLADGLAGEDELSEAWKQSHDPTGPNATAAHEDAHAAATLTASRAVAEVRRRTKDYRVGERLGYEQAYAQAELVREVFGNPFRLTTADPWWLTSTVVALARGIYEDRAFDRLPILADALQDAGCEHPAVLKHCFGPGPHVRGCWVVDLLLGKS